MNKRSDVEFFEGLFVLLAFYSVIGICAYFVFDNMKKPKIHRGVSNIKPAFRTVAK